VEVKRLADPEKQPLHYDSTGASRTKKETETEGKEKLKQKHFALLGILVLLLCFPVNSVYALGQGTAVLNGVGDVLNGIGDFFVGFFTFIFEAFVGIIWAILEFFGKLIFGV